MVPIIHSTDSSSSQCYTVSSQLNDVYSNIEDHTFETATTMTGGFTVTKNLINFNAASLSSALIDLT